MVKVYVYSNCLILGSDVICYVPQRLLTSSFCEHVGASTLASRIVGASARILQKGGHRVVGWPRLVDYEACDASRQYHYAEDHKAGCPSVAVYASQEAGRNRAHSSRRRYHRSHKPSRCGYRISAQLAERAGFRGVRVSKSGTWLLRCATTLRLAASPRISPLLILEQDP